MPFDLADHSLTFMLATQNLVTDPDVRAFAFCCMLLVPISVR